MDRYDALIVDPDLDRRMRLKTAASSVVQFNKVWLVKSIEEAEERMEGEDLFDVVFLNYCLEQDNIAKFIKASKEKKCGQDSAYILVLGGKDQESSTVASNVMIGADGFLFEPFSVDQLVEITELAAKVKAERSGGREKAALSLLLSDVMKQIDSIAYLTSVGYDVGRGRKRFRQMCKVFQALEGDSVTAYFDIAVEKFEAAEIPEKLQKNYKGASKRVKERMEKKLLAELEEGLIDDEDDDTGESSEPAGAAT